MPTPDLWVPASYVDERARELLKSEQARLPRDQPYRDTLPYQDGDVAGVKEATQKGRIEPRILRECARRNPIIAAIILRLQDDVAAFAQRPRYDGDVGIKVSLQDQTAKPTPADLKRMREIEDVLLHGGFRRRHPDTGERGSWDAEGSHRAMGLPSALRAMVADSLTLDACAFRMEVGRDRDRYPVVWWSPVDAALIRYATTEQEGRHAIDRTWQHPYRPDVRPKVKAAFVAMDPEGMGVTREFAWSELAYMVRNPRTDYHLHGYGTSEIEMMVDVVSGILYCLKFNVEYFDSNRVPPSLLALNGGPFDPRVIQDLRKQLSTLSGGAGQFHRLPIWDTELDASAINLIQMRQWDNVGMFFKDLLLFLGNLACALYRMDSTLINMVNFGASNNPLGSGQAAEKRQASREEGLLSLLGALKGMFDDAIVEQYGEEYCLEFTGVRQQDAEQERAESQHRMQFALSTPNEERARRDERPIHDPKDRHLWREVQRAVAEHLGHDPDADDLMDDPKVSVLVRRAYEDAGGEMAEWPDSPVGNPSALQVWSTEHKIGQDGQQGQPGGPEGPVQQAGAPGGAPGQDSGQDPQQDEPMQPWGAPSPYPDGSADPQAGEQDPASATPPGAPQQVQSLGKSILEFVIRKRRSVRPA